jgi:ribosomal protein L27
LDAIGAAEAAIFDEIQREVSRKLGDGDNVPVGQLVSRASSNPFFPYITDGIGEDISLAAAADESVQ